MVIFYIVSDSPEKCKYRETIPESGDCVNCHLSAQRINHPVILIGAALCGGVEESVTFQRSYPQKENGFFDSLTLAQNDILMLLCI